MPYENAHKISLSILELGQEYNINEIVLNKHGFKQSFHNIRFKPETVIGNSESLYLLTKNQYVKRQDKIVIMTLTSIDYNSNSLQQMPFIKLMQYTQR